MLIETNTVHKFLKAALPALGTEKAVEVMITQDELKDHPAQSFNFRIVPSLLRFSILTRHRRHTPMDETSGQWHRVGI
jgi:hypothetical protein